MLISCSRKYFLVSSSDIFWKHFFLDYLSRKLNRMHRAWVSLHRCLKRLVWSNHRSDPSVIQTHLDVLLLLTLDPSVSSERSDVLPLDLLRIWSGLSPSNTWSVSLLHSCRAFVPRWPFWGSLCNPRAKTQQQPASQNTPGLRAIISRWIYWMHAIASMLCNSYWGKLINKCGSVQNAL